MWQYGQPRPAESWGSKVYANTGSHGGSGFSNIPTKGTEVEDLE